MISIQKAYKHWHGHPTENISPLVRQTGRYECGTSSMEKPVKYIAVILMKSNQLRGRAQTNILHLQAMIKQRRSGIRSQEKLFLPIKVTLTMCTQSPGRPAESILYQRDLIKRYVVGSGNKAKSMTLQQRRQLKRHPPLLRCLLLATLLIDTPPINLYIGLNRSAIFFTAMLVKYTQ